jgi:hypothetical protein
MGHLDINQELSTRTFIISKNREKGRKVDRVTDLWSAQCIISVTILALSCGAALGSASTSGGI